MADLRFETRASTVVVHPLTVRGRAWVERFVDYRRDANGAIVVGRADAPVLAAEAKADGLSVRAAKPRRRRSSRTSRPAS